MADIYEGQPDARQATDPITTSRFRPRYRQLSDAEKDLHDRPKAQAEVLESLVMQTPKGREQSLAMTHLEEVVMWAVKGLTA